MRLHTAGSNCLPISITSMSHKVMPHVLTGPVASTSSKGALISPLGASPSLLAEQISACLLLLHCVSACGVLGALCAGLASITPERMVARANVKETDNACNRICNPQR